MCDDQGINSTTNNGVGDTWVGYVCALYDVLQCLLSGRIPYEVSERDRVVCGAASDGGVYAARSHSGSNGNVSSLNEVDNGRSSREGLTLGRLSDESGDEQETQDHGISELFVTEQNNGQTQ